MTVERLRASLSDHYLLEGELGHGGMATVYLAHDVGHDRKVALKTFRPEFSAILGAERFLPVPVAPGPGFSIGPVDSVSHAPSLRPPPGGPPLPGGGDDREPLSPGCAGPLTGRIARCAVPPPGPAARWAASVSG